MFNKLLIANRGEIACRAMRTAKKMGVATVAVYSDADHNALHVAMADEAINIGPAPSTESYLQIEKIINACKQSGADAVYPGYGFLSENAAFAAALANYNIVFVGPGQKAIESMGDKITSKKIAIEAGVSTVPGHTDIIRDPQHAIEIANQIGYPVMLKASAGGGGKGMRVAFDDSECTEGFERASNEAKSSFGDDRVFIEKFIEHPRHIEIQVLADTHGNTIYLNERECSIQRRHQKVIEEAPSAFLDERTRTAMGEQACALARAVNYHSAGTVEFIVDRERNFYFLEMNTRLQVEHPVTEAISGYDLVEQMLKIAAGEKLPMTQSDVPIDGWAVEARVYAENPFREFLPSTGRLQHYSEPAEMEGVRIDSGVVEGGEVSIYYDPLIAKLITHGGNRDEAIQRMSTALDRYTIEGVTTNIPFLAALFSHDDFLSGNISTHFIAEHYPDGFSEATADANSLNNTDAIAALGHFLIRRTALGISGTMRSAAVPERGTYVVIDSDARQTNVCVALDGDNQYKIDIGGQEYRLKTDWMPAGRVITGELDGQAFVYQWQRTFTGYQIKNASHSRDLQVMAPRAAQFFSLMPVRQPVDTSKFLLSPMPGLLVKVLAEEGQSVHTGDSLAIVEAMKMENVLKAERSGVVEKIFEPAGATLDVDQKILEFA